MPDYLLKIPFSRPIMWILAIVIPLLLVYFIYRKLSRGEWETVKCWLPLRMWIWILVVITGAFLPLATSLIINRHTGTLAGITNFFDRGEGYIISAGLLCASWGELEIGQRRGEAFLPFVSIARIMCVLVAIGAAIFYVSTAPQQHNERVYCVRFTIGAVLCSLVGVWIADPKRIELGESH